MADPMRGGSRLIHCAGRDHRAAGRVVARAAARIFSASSRMRI